MADAQAHGGVMYAGIAHVVPIASNRVIGVALALPERGINASLGP